MNFEEMKEKQESLESAMKSLDNQKSLLHEKVKGRFEHTEAMSKSYI